MPKISPPAIPLSGLIAFHKPSGPTSNAVLDSLKHLFADSPLFAEPSGASSGGGGGGGGGKGGKKSKGKGGAPQGVKMGQGGTLDPLADGILVVGVNRGTKQLSRFLGCSKEYRTTALLGVSTDSYDALGAVDGEARWEHVTPELIERVLDRFRGEILQTPPVYSALKMDGKPLYEYARLGLPLPRPVEARKVTVHELVLESFTPSRSVDPVGGHAFAWPEKRLGEEERRTAEETRRLVREAAEGKAEAGDGAVVPEPSTTTATRTTTEATAPSVDAAAPGSSTSAAPAVIPPTFTLRMTVSSGTYVRSIVHDVAQAINSLATVVVLTRTRQGEFFAEAGNVVPWESVRAAADENERRYQEERPAILAEKTRRREELKAIQKEKTRVEREARRRAKEDAAALAAAADDDEEAALNVGSSSSTTAAAAPAPAEPPAAKDDEEEQANAVAPVVAAAAAAAAPPPAPEAKKRRTMDELFDWEREILAKFEEHLA